MTTYVVTPSNWNTLGFWQGISETVAGHTLDFSALGPAFTLQFSETTGILQLSDGTSTFSVGEAGTAGVDANLGGTTSLEFFTTVLGTQGEESFTGSAGADSISGGDGNDSLDGGAGNDTLLGGDGNDTLLGGDGDDSLVGGAGNNVYTGDAGADTFDGSGLGWDYASYLTSAGAVTIDLTDGLAESGGDAQGDTLIGIEEIDLSDLGNDSLVMGGDLVSAYGHGGDDTIIGSALDNTIEGGDGQDSLSGGAGADTLVGGAGVDALAGGLGDDSLVGGTDGFGDQFVLEDNHGNDTVSDGDNTGSIEARDGVTTNVVVTYSATNFVGTFVSGGDTATFDGIHKITTGIGNDLLDGSANSAGLLLYAGDGQNTVLGGAGDDDLRGGTGNDSLVGNDGNDYFESKGGNDTVIGGAGNDNLNAAGAVAGDTLSFDAGSGADSLFGRDNVDVADLGTGDDYAQTAGGSDTIDAGGGADTIFAEADADLIRISDGFNGTQIDGGEGVTTGTDRDTLDFSALTTGITVNYSGTEAGTVTIGGDSLTFEGIEELTLTAFNNTVIGSGLGDTISGGDGNDYIDGGAGDDLLTTGLGQDTLIGGAGNDTLMNSDGDDSLDGGAGDDSIVATGGQDTLRGGTGADTMEGGDDADVFIIEDGFGNDVITGGEGTTDPSDSDFDTIDLRALTGAITVTYTGNEAGTITDGADTITFSEIEKLILTNGNDNLNGTLDSVGLAADGGAGNDTLQGGTGNDSLSSGSGDDLVNGGAGNDTLFSSTGDDTLDGAAGDDVIDAGEGHDLVHGGSGNDTIQGGLGRDTLIGGDGNDEFDGGNDADDIQGGAGNDKITGGSGDDTLTGGAGADQMSGGSDADTFIIEDGFGNDIITGGEGGADDDVIDMSGLSGPVTVTYAATGGETGTITDGTDTINFDEIERIILTENADSVDGSDNTTGLDIDALGGHDTVVGGSGADRIDGGAGNDSILGGSGSDTIIGNAGNDTLSGGAGDDVFVYSVGDGNDTITDFNSGNTGALGDGNTTNNDFINLSGFYDNLRELREDYADNGVLDQSNSIADGGSVDYSNNNQFGTDDSLTFQGADQFSFTADNTGVVCFTSGTAIRTPNGDVLIDDLRIGDLVTTLDNGPQPIRWIGTTSFGPRQLAENPNLRPVLINQGILGVARDMLVSPQHGMMIDSDHLARATHLVDHIKGIRTANGRKNVTYIHLMFEAHQIIFAENAPSESFFPGPMALRMMDHTTRTAVCSIYPALRTAHLKDDTERIYSAQARRFVHKRDINAALAVSPRMTLCAAQ